MNKSESLKIAKEYLGKEVEVVIDRPMGSKHPKHSFIYEVHYGHLQGIKAPDGEDLDAYYIGENRLLEKGVGRCIAIIHRKDDDDDKLVVSALALTDEEIEKLVGFQEKYFYHIIIR